MKNTLLVILFFALHGQLVAQSVPYGVSQKIGHSKLDSILRYAENYEYVKGQGFPDFYGKNWDGSSISNENLLGKVTFVNFWFEACPSCHLLFPKLNELVEKYRSNKNFQVVSLTFDDTGVTKKSVEKYKIDYPAYSVNKDSCIRLNWQKGYPSNYIVGADGRIVFGHGGFGGIGQDVFMEVYQPKIDSLLSLLMYQSLK